MDLCDRLAALEEAPWGDWYGKPLDQRGLARLLRHHRIKPKQVWIDGKNKRAYERDQFEDAFTRYLVPLAARSDSPLDVLSSNGNGPSGLGDLAARTPVEDLGAHCSDVLELDDTVAMFVDQLDAEIVDVSANGAVG